MIKYHQLAFFLIFIFSSCNTFTSSPANINLVSQATNLHGSFWNKAAYNDPCVLKKDNQYVMFLSRNVEDIYTDGRLEPVSSFYAVSNDGITWNLEANEILKLGSSTEWDYNKVETPSVVFFKNQYHLYYSGGSQNANPVSYKIGHATSQNAITWEKDSANPILTSASIVDGSQVLHVAEPGAVVFNDKIYLYFVVTIQRTEASYPSAKNEIYLAISEDGYGFSTPIKVLAQTEKYSAEKGFVGYSTPSALVNNGKLELFYDVFFQTNNNINQYEQILIQRAVSADGIHFTEDTNSLLKREDFTWTKRELRGGSALLESDLVKMWFSGDNYSFINGTWSGEMTIGYAYWKLE